MRTCCVCFREYKLFPKERVYNEFRKKRTVYVGKCPYCKTIDTRIGEGKHGNIYLEYD